MNATTNAIRATHGVNPSAPEIRPDRCPVIDDRTIRDGLIHAMASQRDYTAPSSGQNPNLHFLRLGQEVAAEGLGYHHHPRVPGQLGGDEYRKGQALECALFSSIAIGALILGCPVGDVARYLAPAQRCREQLDGLRDRSAVSALLLHALSHAFLGAEKVRPANKVGATATLCTLTAVLSQPHLSLMHSSLVSCRGGSR